MRLKRITKALPASALAATMLLGAGATQAADVYLRAVPFTKTLTVPGATTSPTAAMWGFASCNSTWTCGDATAPGPQIDVDLVDGASLTIHVQNTLPVPVSIAVPGQVESGAGAPVMFAPDTRSRDRVRSFTHETGPGTTLVPTENSYTWSNLRPGTYMYQSGTMPSIQVPMGMYGALVVTDGTAAYPGIEPDDDAVMLLSEVDLILTEAIAAYPSTVNYNPTFLLVNGEVSPAESLQNVGGDGALLVRFLNAGLRSHTPSLFTRTDGVDENNVPLAPELVSLQLDLIAEDGNPYPGLARRQSHVLLPAGKTSDALATPGADARFAVFDRSPSFANAELPDGAVIAHVEVGSPAPLPADPGITEQAYDVIEDTPYPFVPQAASINVISEPLNGALATDPDTTNGYIYTPFQDFSGTDGFTYYYNNQAHHVTFNVSFVNDAPTAGADAYANVLGADIVVAAPGVLGNDADVDGDTLTPVLDGSVNGLTLGTDGSFSYAGSNGSTTFQYHVTDGKGGQSVPVEVTLTVNPVLSLSLSVTDPDNAAVNNFRWTVEEDKTFKVDPNDPQDEVLGNNFHPSYMPVVAQGINGVARSLDSEAIVDYGDTFASLALDPTKHYYVSVLPLDAMNVTEDGDRIGHTLGAATIAPGQTSIDIVVNKQPLDYGQISAIIFEDNSPTNGAISGNENPLGGFQITVEDGGGRYGIAAGVMSQDADGNPLTNALDCFEGVDPPPPGVILSCPDTQANRDADIVGQVLIKNLFPGKYGLSATPPLGEEEKWVQTTTIEGTRIDDAWVKPGEPAFFTEFGPVGWHVFIGFVSQERIAAQNPAANPEFTGTTGSISGKVTNYHMSRPPVQTLHDSGSYDSLAHTRAWVGLNAANGVGDNIAMVQADEDGSFTISGVPADGDYQLVVWDTYLDQVIAYRGVTQAELQSNAAIGNVPVFNWFSRLENNVYLDDGGGNPLNAGNGVRDEGEVGLQEQNINIRWRDGSVYQSYPTDREGFVPFDQVFPFFNWLIAEVDYARFKPTGLAVTVDGGGAPADGIMNPQLQTTTAGTADDFTINNDFTRVEKGPVLTEGFQGFLGQTSIFDWGKQPWAPGENGGIAGIVYYAITRAEGDPRKAAAEPWEPGIPRVTVRLYREIQTSAGGTTLALVDETTTDSWDDSVPDLCPGADPIDATFLNNDITRCYDGLRNFNQARPAVFDGGYAFNDIPPGKYVVEVVPPEGYTLVKEEDVNVSFGNGFAAPYMPIPGGAVIPALPDVAMVGDVVDAAPGLAQPACVGELREVPTVLSLFPDAREEAPYAESMRRLCDRKAVLLEDQGQAAADFYLFTQAPAAAHVVGMVLDDLAQEFDPASPQFGEKWAPPYVPVAVFDHTGREISRTYSDQWGRYNMLMPSTFSANEPAPSGMSPAMLMTCMNDPGPIEVNGELVVDPQFNPMYSNFCYTFQFMPGTYTFLDTPVLPVSAYASGYSAVDCALPTGTPMIRSVDSGSTFGGPIVQLGGSLTINSMGTTPVLDPRYEGPLVNNGTLKTMDRDFGFGGQGSVTLNGVPLTISSWNSDSIDVTIEDADGLDRPISTGQLVVTNAAGVATETAVTITVLANSDADPIVVHPGESIQAAIEDAPFGALIYVEPGVYNESVIMWKPVRLQGAGAGVTIINGVKRPTEKLVAWRNKVDQLYADGLINALPNQEVGAAGLIDSEGATIMVIGRDTNNRNLGAFSRWNSSIDGFSITGGDVGGGIFVNSYAHDLVISNNRVFGNSGTWHGGIRIGQPFLELPPPAVTNQGRLVMPSFNDNVRILYNQIVNNGGLGGAGGGVSIATGSTDYRLQSNYVCGNFTTGDGGGIGHLGLSDGGFIIDNQIMFNQNFNQQTSVSGGGIFVGGEPEVGALTAGSGSVSIIGNTIHGNQAASGHGGGIRTQFVNGLDVAADSRQGRWHRIQITTNTIVNNVAGWSGAGVSLHDMARTNNVLSSNVIARNDSTATVAATFDTVDPNDPTVPASSPQVAGVATESHSPLLLLALPNGTPTFSSIPTGQFNSNTISENRAFHYGITNVNDGLVGLLPELSQQTVGQCLSGAQFWDVDPLLPGGTNAPGNSSPDTVPGGLLCNGGRTLITPPGPGPIAALPALDEGGNTWIDVRFGPLTTDPALLP